MESIQMRLWIQGSSVRDRRKDENNGNVLQ